MSRIILDLEHKNTLDAIKVWGERSQLEILQEEAGEVVTALARFKRDRCGREKVAEEIADVMVSAMSVIPMLDIQELVEYYIGAKLERLGQRIEDYNNKPLVPDIVKGSFIGIKMCKCESPIKSNKMSGNCCIFCMGVING